MQFVRYISCLVFFTFLLISNNLLAQNQDVLDSLFMQLKDVKNAQIKVDLLNQIANEYQSSQPLIAYEYAQQSLYFAEQQSYQSGIADAFLQIAGSYYFQGNYLKDSEYLFRALPIYEKLNDSTKIAKVYGYIGSVYEGQADYEKQIEYFHHALKIAKSVKDEKFIATLLSNGLGNAYKMHNNLERALMYHYEAMKMREKINDHHGLANSFLYLGEAYMAKKDYEKARYYFENSLQKNHYLNDRHGLSVTYLQLGSIEYEQGNYKKAANLYDSSLQIAATAYLQPDVKAACDKLAITYTKLGKFESAYDFLSKSVAINDSLNNAGNKKKIAELQASYEIKQLQRETERQNRERERKNALQYSGIFFITILLFVCIFIFGRFNIAISLVEKMLFFTFLLCFEFILLLTDPYVENITNREPSFILLANALIALFIVPIHQYLENRLKNKWFRNENRTSTVNEEMARNETTARRGDAEIM